jgi:hypothetical protein
VNVVTDGREENAHGSWYYAAHLGKGIVLVGVVVWAIVSAIRTVL